MKRTLLFAPITSDFECDEIMSTTEKITLLEELQIDKTLLNEQTSQITIFPNPNNGNFIFKIPKEITPINITVFNYLGKIVYKDNKVISNKIMLNNQKTGLYFIKILTESDILTEKFIIE